MNYGRYFDGVTNSVYDTVGVNEYFPNVFRLNFGNNSSLLRKWFNCSNALNDCHDDLAGVVERIPGDIVVDLPQVCPRGL